MAHFNSARTSRIRFRRARVVVLPLLLVFLVSAGGGTAVALSTGPSCQFTYGASLSPYNSTKTKITSYGGSTSCDRVVNSIYAEAWLKDSNGNFVATAPSQVCNPCSNADSHGAYGPVPNNSVWTVQYETNVGLSKAHWTTWDPVNCTVYNPDSAGNYHDLECTYQQTFVANTSITVSGPALEDVGIAVDD
jgi:hypothetical protein